MKTSIVFKRARMRIADGNAWFICFAIEQETSTRSKLKAKDIIHTRMGSQYKTLENWLEENGVPIYRYTNWKALIKEYRLRWLDSLIAEFEAKGD